MNLEIYEARTLNFNINVEGFLVYRADNYYIIPIDTMLISNGAQELNDLVYLGAYLVDRDSIKFKCSMPIFRK